MYQSKFFFSLSIYQSKRCNDSPAGSRRITQHNTHDEGCDLLEAGLQGRGPKIVLLAPEVGHRLAIVNLAHQIKGLLKIPCSIGMCVPTEILYFRLVLEGCSTGLEKWVNGCPSTHYLAAILWWGSSSGVNLRRLLVCASSEADRLSYISQWPAVHFLRVVLDISRKATAVKERADCNDRLHCCTQKPRLYSYKLYFRCVSCTR